MNWAKLKRFVLARRHQYREETSDLAQSLAAETDGVHLSPEWEDQLSFDAELSRALRSESVPAHLREAILQVAPTRVSQIKGGASWGWVQSLRQRLTTPLPWPRAVWLAVGVALIVLLTMPLWLPSRATFQDYRQEIVLDAWTAPRHLAFHGKDLSEIQKWIQREGAPWPNHFPKALGEVTAAGCQLLQAHGQRVTLICFADGVQHIHLFVMDQLDLPGTPGELFPDFSECQGWNTASWTCNGQTFILTGYKGLAFVRQFRKEGHWDWNG